MFNGLRECAEVPLQFWHDFGMMGTGENHANYADCSSDSPAFGGLQRPEKRN
jgi:hypothetical protein